MGRFYGGAGCNQYLELLPHFPSAVQNFARHQALFWDERILPRVRPLEPSADFGSGLPAIVIGHYGQDWARFCRETPGPWTLFWPEPLPETVTAALAERPSEAALPWLNALRPDLAQGTLKFCTYRLTSHCDGAGTTQLIHNLRPQHVMFVHGTTAYLSDLAGLEELQSRYQLHLPSPGKGVDFPVGSTFMQPDAPEPLYEGEVTETSDAVIAVLPETLTADPRWRQLAETGIVQARWQGNELVIKGVAHQKLLQSGSQANAALEISCQRCRFWQHQFCRNSASPLGGFRVNPDGRCLEFEPKLPGGEGSDL